MDNILLDVVLVNLLEMLLDKTVFGLEMLVLVSFVGFCVGILGVEVGS